MKKLCESPLLLEKKVQLKRLENYLKFSLTELEIHSAVIFGRAARIEQSNDIYRDIDIVAYSDIFSREKSQECISIIEQIGGDFLDKKPIFLEDFISPRIEYFYVIDDTIFDINIFPPYLSGYNNMETNVIHDSVEVIIGAMYQNAISLFGTTPFESLLKQEFIPFYNETSREKRLQLLEKRLRSSIFNIQHLIMQGEVNLLPYIYKTRTYFIKWLFINARIYPIDLNRYLEKQLIEMLHIPIQDVDSLMMIGENISVANENFIKTIYKYLEVLK